jgi:hypothetical protein
MLLQDQNGFYQVGERVFYSKTLALIEATKTNQTPRWFFADEKFATVPWATGHCADISEVYRKRARQLREKYDYLILSYSGGSDSFTAFKSFVEEGLLVDEIVVRWPVKATQDRYKVSYEVAPSNMLSEWDLVIKQDLKFIEQHYPTVKITIFDWSDELDSELVENDWYSVNDHLNPGVFRKYAGVSIQEQQMIDSGKSVAVIWGIDKPQLRYDNGNVYFYFLDKLVNTRSVDNLNERAIELFYWSADCPEVVHAQARTVYEYFVRNPDQTDLIDWSKDSSSKKAQYDAIVKSLIYPQWSINTFQAGKPSSMVWNEYDAWMFKDLKEHRFFQSWHYGLNSIANAVDKKFHQTTKTGRFEGWTGFVSPMYNLGPIYKSLDI